MTLGTDTLASLLEGQGMIEKIISGAQTGADRAGLDAALALGLDVGGTVPKGRVTEDGHLTDEEMARYKLHESRFNGYPSRTRTNVQSSDGTVVFGVPTSAGSAKTIRLCDDLAKPILVLDEVTLSVMRHDAIKVFRSWAKANGVRVLNVAGNRESKNPGIYNRTLAFLMDALGGMA